MFSDDVAQVQAFDRIMEQLMTRKQRAEEILWGTLTDVLYRHRSVSKEEIKRRRERMERRARAMEAAAARGEMMSTITEDSDEDDSNSYTHTNASFEDDVSTRGSTAGAPTSGCSTKAQKRCEKYEPSSSSTRATMFSRSIRSGFAKATAQAVG